MKKPVVPKPIFPVGHRFSISGEYPHQYNQHIPQPGKIAVLVKILRSWSWKRTIILPKIYDLLTKSIRSLDLYDRMYHDLMIVLFQFFVWKIKIFEDLIFQIKDRIQKNVVFIKIKFVKYVVLSENDRILFANNRILSAGNVYF